MVHTLQNCEEQVTPLSPLSKESWCYRRSWW